ncbi:MAG: DUF4149 domain-containing protein [Nitrospiraceae bacterium]|nr:MAG: DUF4149 domain-containing protein [Nitrospiraceae bacterium]
MMRLYNVFMNKVWSFCYNLILSLWIGGISIFTFIVTPAVFRSFERDMAGRIVGKLFPGYFIYNLALSALALALLIMIRSFLTSKAFKFSLVLIICAIIINLFVAFKLHPDINRIKQEIHSFETPADDSPLRKQFGRLHAVSATLNLLLLADGITLLVFSSVMKKQ